MDPEAPLADHETNFRRALDHELQRISAFYEKKVGRKLLVSPSALAKTLRCFGLQQRADGKRWYYCPGLQFATTECGCQFWIPYR